MKETKNIKKTYVILGVLILGFALGVFAYDLYEDLNMNGYGIFNVTEIKSQYGEGITMDTIVVDDITAQEQSIFEAGLTTGGNISFVGDGVISIASPTEPIKDIFIRNCVRQYSANNTLWCCGVTNSGNWRCV